MSKKTSVVIVILIVVAVLVGLWAQNRAKPKAGQMAGQNNSTGAQTNSQTRPDLSIEPAKITQVDKAKLPEGFPADFPMEKDAQIVSNYNSTKDGTTQSTREFISKKTLAENYKLYSDYLTKNGWNILNKSDTQALKSLYAKKDNASVTINMNQNPTTKANLVEVSFLIRQ